MTNNNNNDQFIVEGACLIRPLGFTREDYPCWKDKMEMYIKSTLYILWLIITNGDISIPRPKAEWTNTNLAIIKLNKKPHYTLTCALSRNEYNKICGLKIAKEIRQSLSINYEGTKDVQLRKVVALTRHYESFSMRDKESMDDMFGRLQVLLKKLEALGHTFIKAQINLKIHDNFPKVWEPKTMVIQEAQNLKTQHGL